MFENIKQRIIKNLMGEISCLEANDLEIVGHYMLCAIEGQPLLHHGLNKDSRPSGYTVDTFSQDSCVIGEYSTEKEYFLDYKSDNIDGSYKKIRKDIEHAYGHSEENGIKKIYLICSQEEPPSFRQKFNATDIFINNREKIIVYDCREIAKTIYQQSIDNAAHAEFYKQCFPNFSQELDNYEYYGKIPCKCENFQTDLEVIKVIEQHYNDSKSICVLHGMSGSGKTQMTIDYIHLKKKEFENYIWISGDDWKENTSLCAVERSRGGTPINVAGMFNTRKTILVIDSIERMLSIEHFAELREGFNKGSVILATSQNANPGCEYYLAMPELSTEVARKILGEETSEEEEVNSIIEKCRCSPLILSTIRKMVEMEGVSRKDLYSEILEAPDEVSGNDGKSIIAKILSKLDDATFASLKKIANTGLTVFDLNFLRKFTKNLSCHKLQQLSILLSTNTQGIVKIHDLICDVMRDAKNFEIANAIDQYIDDVRGEMTPSVLRQIYLAYEVIKEYKSRERQIDWLTYALLQVEREEKHIIANEIYLKHFEKGLSLAIVMCLIEAREIYSYTIESKIEREEFYKNCALEYENAIVLYDDTDIKIELLHHLGKALRRCREYEKAQEVFKSVLRINPESYATYGQLITLGTFRQEGLKESGNECIKTLLEKLLEDNSEIPLRVSLSVIARLRSYKEIALEMVNDEVKVSKIAQIVSMAALEGLDKFFEAFVSFSSIFGYHYNEICIVLAANIKDMMLENVEERQWVNACEALINVAAMALKADKQDLWNMLQEKSLFFAEMLERKKDLNPYETRALAKMHIQCSNPQKALEIIGRLSIEKHDHWVMYRRAEAELFLGDMNALDSALKAFDLLLEDTKNIERKSSYLDLISKCYEGKGEIDNAIGKLEEAIMCCNDEKYKGELLQRKSMLDKMV